MAKVGIKNTKEVLELARFLTLYLIKEIKDDGVQVDDFVRLLKTPAFMAKFLPAAEEALKIKEEIDDLDFMEGYELAQYMYSFGRDVLAHIKS